MMLAHATLSLTNFHRLQLKDRPTSINFIILQILQGEIQVITFTRHTSLSQRQALPHTVVEDLEVKFPSRWKFQMDTHSMGGSRVHCSKLGDFSE
jgi:hypothetical protein